MRRASLLALLFVLGTVSCADDSLTEVVVVVDAQIGIRAVASHVSIRVTSGDASTAVPTNVASEQTIGTNDAPVTFPVRVAVVPQNGDATRRYLVEATAFDNDGMPRARVRAISSFVRGRILELRLVLENTCLDVLSCSESETCHAASCSSAEVDEKTLSPYDGAGGSFREEHFLKTGPKRGSMDSVAIDGDTIAIGLANSDAPVDIFAVGSVAIFNRSPATGEIVFDQIVQPPNPSGYSFCGATVALSGDMLVMGCPLDTMVGSGVMTTYGPGGGDASGTVFVFRRDDNGIFQVEAALKSPHPRAASTSGHNYANALAASGDVIVVGDAEDDSGFELGSAPGDPWDPANRATYGGGSVFVFRRVSEVWTLERHLKHHDIAGMPGYGGGFGSAVDIESDRLVVGAPADEYGDKRVRNGAPFAVGTRMAGSGSVSTFSYIGGIWTRESFIQGSHVEYEDNFGSALSLDGGTLVVLAPDDRSTARGVNPATAPLDESPSSAAYLFEVDGSGSWFEKAWIKPPGELSDDTGQMLISLSGDSFVIGMRYEDATVRGVGAESNATRSRNPDQGAAFAYRRSAGVWIFDAYLKASNGDADDQFGASVAASEHGILVIAPGEDGGGMTVDDFSNPSGSENSGAAYWFVPNP